MGQDYPLISNQEMVELYTNYPNKIWMTGINLTKWANKSPAEKFTVCHFFRDLRVRNVKLKQAFSFPARQLMRALPIRKKRYITMADGSEWDIY